MMLCTDCLLGRRKRKKGDKRAEIRVAIDCDGIQQRGEDAATSHGEVKLREVVHIGGPLKTCAVRVPVK